MQSAVYRRTFAKPAAAGPLPVSGGRELPALADNSGPRRIRLLIVADGYHYLGAPCGLDFSCAPSGLSQFVECLLASGGPVRFDIALAHLDRRDGTAMMAADRRIRRRMPGFAFDDPKQFRADRFDALLLFGCVEQLSRDDAEGRPRLASDGRRYPLDRLADGEAAAIEAFQRGGGGLFLAGDAGRAGGLMGAGLARAALMRRWTQGGRGSRAAAPILSRPATSGDFPAAIDGGLPPVPQRVRAGPPGTTGLCAYDGHRAGIGRTLTALTWRPFLNASLAEFRRPVDDGESAARADSRRVEVRCAELVQWLARPAAAPLPCKQGS